MFTEEALKRVQQTADVIHAVAAQKGMVDRDHPEVAIPDNFKIVDMAGRFKTAYRKTGTMNTALVGSFVDYCKDTDTKENAVCMIDNKTMKATTIFNYGNKDAPGHCDYTAVLALEATAEYKAVQKAVGVQRHDQKALAHLLEDLEPIVTAVDSDGIVMTLLTAITAIRKVEINTEKNTTHEAGDFRANRSTLEKAEAKAAGFIPMPSVLLFKFVPYLGLKERTFRVRVVCHLGDSEPSFGLQFIGHELIQQDMANEFVELLDSKLAGIIDHIYVGGFTKQS